MLQGFVDNFPDIKIKAVLAARLHVKAHDKRQYVVALKYKNEEEYRYLVASDLSWRFADFAIMYTLRWLVEVFIQDWKVHCGWNKLSKQQGVEGSEQSIRLKKKQPGIACRQSDRAPQSRKFTQYH